MNTTTSSIRGVGFLVLLLLTFSLQDIAVKWAIMSGLGLVWASGLYLMARAYSLTQASVVAPFEYATLPINAAWGFLLWRTAVGPFSSPEPGNTLTYQWFPLADLTALIVAPACIPQLLQTSATGVVHSQADAHVAAARH
jgi:hypothetical protein